ncbi:CRISPR-associated protein Csc3 [Halarchaeum rubridurum]|uniref:CRISPR-associated protein Csc3 n=1 Tax=Halarchaeum rubridurum TaxID=489911 RepID=A0A830FUW6_9EURY|nr:type I-D CRISPR-associated protein Cas10d/Csc3 [Halarchaeum rubridurum]MBP1954659.1 CRISPR-associated protein Csc3 [Halarchaeum rubridurum]GGM62803.1 hypothetical protein GCM10009017_11190 [Halarchaeum rubridurum]
MTNAIKDDITELAKLAYDAVRPRNQYDYQPYSVERVFRESVKAVKNTHGIRIDPDEATMRIAGRLEKLPSRTRKARRVKAEESESGDPFHERVERYAETFVQRLLVERYECKPSLLKRQANDLADGFYAATIRLQRETTDDTTETN